jgi:hypothetical protein
LIADRLPLRFHTNELSANPTDWAIRMSALALNIKEIQDDGHRVRSIVIQSTSGDDFESCSLDRAESIQQPALTS